MNTTLVSTFLCVLIVIIGITYSSTSSVVSDDLIPVDIDDIDFDMNYPGHDLDVRAAKSRFWKRAPQRKFWKRSTFESSLNNMNKNDETVQSLLEKSQQHDKH